MNYKHLYFMFFLSFSKLALSASMTEVEFNDFVPNLLQMQMDGLFDEEEDEPIVQIRGFQHLCSIPDISRQE